MSVLQLDKLHISIIDMEITNSSSCNFGASAGANLSISPNEKSK